MSAALQNFLCFLIKTIFPEEELGELVYLFWVVSKLSVCLSLLPGVPVSSRLASPGDAVLLPAENST